MAHDGTKSIGRAGAPSAPPFAVASGERVESFRDPDCLEPDAIAGFVDGWLTGDELAQVEAHLGRCAECRRCVSELAKASGEASRASHPAGPEGPPSQGGAGGEGRGPPAVSRGMILGRYVVDALLGEGGMGVVYAAYDPELERKIALKLLRSTSGEGPEAQARLLREARAMARLSHLNVVTVHDVGIHEGQLFLAMEYVEGVTLRSWLRRESRPSREVLRALLQAGRGLAAAHAVGVVHRDVKPDNVLVDGRGRVRVTDFGLARLPPSPAPGPGGAAGARGGGRANENFVNSTKTGALVGTPAYMAPEQHAGQAADEKSDQFSFCVMLYEALYRTRPFEGSTLRELADAARGGRVREPPSPAAVPSRVRKALLRGLSADPQKRFASIDALLEALSDEPGARRRVAAAALGASLALGAVAFAYRRGRPDPRLTCTGAGQRLEGAWGAARKEAVRAAFLATGKPFAPDAWQGVERALDGYARDWAAMRTEACEATHLWGEQSAELLDLRMACLDDRQRELGAMTEVLAHADGDVVAKAAGASRSLSPLAPCGDAKALRARERPPESAAALKVEALRGELSRAKALQEGGKYREALALSERAAEAAEALGYRPLLAAALQRHGELRGLSRDTKGAEAILWRAAAMADEVRDDPTRARALTLLFVYAGGVNANRDLAPFLNEQAAAAIARAGGDPETDVLRRANLAALLQERGEYDAALREYEGGRAVAEGSFGPESRQAQMCLNGAGQALMARGDHAAALAVFWRALEAAERTLGHHHPFLEVPLSSIGTALAEQLQFDEAATHFERALTIIEGASGADSPRSMYALCNAGLIRNEQGHYEQALAYLRRAMAMFEAQLRADNPRFLGLLAGLGEAHLGLGQRRQAVAYLERAVRLSVDVAGAPDLARARFALARALPESGPDRRRARALALAARDAYRAAKNSPLDARNLRLVEQWLERHLGG